MKIGDTVFIHGYIDEIRKDMVIIHNKGGYFGTIPSEVICGKIPERKTGRWIREGSAFNLRCPYCGKFFVEPVGSKFDFCPTCGAYMRGEEDK